MYLQQHNNITMQLRCLMILAISLGLAVHGTTGQDSSQDQQFEAFNEDWQKANDDFEDISSSIEAFLGRLNIDPTTLAIGQTISQRMSSIRAVMSVQMSQSNRQELKEIKEELQELKEKVADLLRAVAAIEEMANMNGWTDIEEEAARLRREIQKLQRDLEELCNRVKRLCKYWCGGDPHITQPIEGSFTPLIYDVFGQDGETYLALDIPALGLTISGTLKSVGANFYIGDLTITYKGLVIELDVYEITVDGQVFSWAQNTVTKSVGDETVQVEIASEEVIITFGEETMTIRRKGETNLNMFAYSDIPDNAGGLMGEMRQYSRISYDQNGASLILTDIDQTTTEIPLENRGTSLRFNGQNVKPFRDLLLRNCLSCS